MAYIDTPASYTRSMQRGVDARLEVGRRTRAPRGEFAPGVDGLGNVGAVAGAVQGAQAASSTAATLANIATIVGTVAQVGAVGAGLYFGRQDAKDAKKRADEQDALAAKEAKRAAVLQQQQVNDQRAVEFAKAGLDAQGRPLPGITGAIARVPGGWFTVGGAGLVVVGLAAFLLLRRKKA